MNQKNTEEYLGGIPTTIFAGSQVVKERVITSQSGLKLKYTRIPGQVIRIEDPKDPHVFFQAQLHKESTPVAPDRLLNVLHVTLRTKDKDGNKHPDFFASLLLKKTIDDFFTKGQVIDILLGEWRSETELLASNWRQYMQKRYAEKLGPEESAFSTWTGQQAKKLNYTKAQVVEDQDGNVFAYFYKAEPINLSKVFDSMRKQNG